MPHRNFRKNFSTNSFRSSVSLRLFLLLDLFVKSTNWCVKAGQSLLFNPHPCSLNLSYRTRFYLQPFLFSTPWRKKSNLLSFKKCHWVWILFLYPNFMQQVYNKMFQWICQLNLVLTYEKPLLLYLIMVSVGHIFALIYLLGSRFNILDSNSRCFFWKWKKIQEKNDILVDFNMKRIFIAGILPHLGQGCRYSTRLGVE